MTMLVRALPVLLLLAAPVAAGPGAAARAGTPGTVARDHGGEPDATAVAPTRPAGLARLQNETRPQPLPLPPSAAARIAPTGAVRRAPATSTGTAPSLPVRLLPGRRTPRREDGEPPGLSSAT